MTDVPGRAWTGARDTSCLVVSKERVRAVRVGVGRRTYAGEVGLGPSGLGGRE
ncbi:hypothetical protein [Streptomyces phaeochromogenes]